MRIRFLVAVAALVLPLSVKAQSYTYTYTGSDFTYSTVNNQIQNPPGTVAAPYSTSSSITGSFTISGNIDSLNNHVFYDAGPFSFTDGVQTISSADGDDLFIEISTNASGDLTSYSIGPQSGSDIYDSMELNSSPSPASSTKLDVDGDGTEIVLAATNNVGSFSGPVAATPEPGSLALLGSGMAGLALQLRRRMRRS